MYVSMRCLCCFRFEAFAVRRSESFSPMSKAGGVFGVFIVVESEGVGLDASSVWGGIMLLLCCC